MHVTLPRKYRPQNFQDLKGQSVLVKVLSKAISQKSLATGYLLTGIRGVGKTTSARIVAKLINCTSVVSNGNQVVSCDACANCSSNENHPDIIEIDAASNTSVENIRQIIESAEYRPLLGTHKIFIIDEVHMLSKNAFNALLKTLEEPPLNVLFILATTEVSKVPLTIVSRCQRFDLRRLSPEEIIDLLKQIANSEGIQYEEDALKVISHKAEGSARDAISLLDQASILANKEIVTRNLIYEMTGTVSSCDVIRILKAISENEATLGIKILNDLYVNSTDLVSTLEELVNLVGYIIKVKIDERLHSDLYQHIQEDIDCVAAKYTIEKISILWQIFINGIQEIKDSHRQLLSFEILLIKAVYGQSIYNSKQPNHKSRFP